MTVDRRDLFRGLGPSLITCRAGPTGSFAVAVVPPYFIPEDEAAADIDAEWLEACAFGSLWHFDARTYPKHAFVRHEDTGLAYDIGLLDGDRLGLIQLDVRCCPGNEAADPELIVGHAACLVTNAFWFKIFPSMSGPCYLEFPHRSREDSVLLDAPSIPITPVSAWAFPRSRGWD